MLFGKVIKEGTPFVFGEESDDTQQVVPVLLLTNIALGSENQAQTSLWIKKDQQ